MAFRLEIEDFGAFYERTYAGAFRAALGVVRDPSLAADVTHEAYAAAYAARTRFRGDSPGQAWLYRIVVNQALAALRRRRIFVREIKPYELTRLDNTALSADRLSVVDALQRLAPRQRAAVVLRYYHDLDYETIAEVLETTSSNVGVMLARALARLRSELQPEQPTTQATETVR